MNKPHTKLKLAVLLLLAGLLAIEATAQPAGPTTLKDAYKAHFYVGVAINRTITTSTAVQADNANRNLDQINQDISIVTNQFNQISPENDLKWQLIQPRAGADGYNFGPADAYVNFGLAHNLYIVGHVLVWHGQTPNWVFQGTNPPPQMTPPPVHGRLGHQRDQCLWRPALRPGFWQWLWI